MIAAKKLEMEYKDKKIYYFLKAVPYLQFSDTALKAVAGRLFISIARLKELIHEFKSGGHNGK